MYAKAPQRNINIYIREDAAARKSRNFRYGIANDKQIGVYCISSTVEDPPYRSFDKFFFHQD